MLAPQELFFLFVIVAIVASLVIGVPVGMAVGWRWQRAVRGVLAGVSGAFAGVYLLYVVERYKIPVPVVSRTIGVVSVVVLSACTAWGAVWWAGDARPKPAGPDKWHPPGSDEVA